MRTLISLAVVLLVFAFIAKTNVSFRPFKISFDAPYLAIGYFFLVVAIVFIQFQSNKDGKLSGYEKGLQDGIDASREVFVDFLKEQKKQAEMQETEK